MHLCVRSLEVSLEKQRGDVEWPSLREEGGGAGTSEQSTAEVPLRGPVADQLSQAELEELQKKIAEATKTEVSHYIFWNSQTFVETIFTNQGVPYM